MVSYLFSFFFIFFNFFIFDVVYDFLFWGGACGNKLNLVASRPTPVPTLQDLGFYCKTCASRKHLVMHGREQQKVKSDTSIEVKTIKTQCSPYGDIGTGFETSEKENQW